MPDQKYITNPALVKPNIILPSLHIKLSLMKLFLKTLDEQGSCLNNIATRFPHLSAAKEEIFVGP